VAKLYLVATPIGNLEDVSQRALRILQEAHMVACEDTRHTQILLRKHDIRAKHLTAYTEFNHKRKVAELVGQLDRGWDVALVSDAETHALSDPGERLVRACVAAGAYDAALFQLNTDGVALSVLSAFIFALYFSLAERILKRYGTPTLLVYGFGFALLAWAVFRPLWTLPWSTTTSDIYLLLLGVIIVATVIPFGLTLAAVKLIPAARVGLTATIEPVVAAIAAFLVLGEQLTPPQIAGGAIVIVAILIAQSLRPTADSV